MRLLRPPLLPFPGSTGPAPFPKGPVPMVEAGFTWGFSPKGFTWETQWARSGRESYFHLKALTVAEPLPGMTFLRVLPPSGLC